ncbi:hypothetical protein ABPG72_019922 [Tetrahymena utriculariae]
MNQINIQLKEKVSQLEAKLQEFMQKQQNNTQKFEPKETQMKTSQKIDQVQPQQVVNTWKPVFLFINYKLKYLKEREKNKKHRRIIQITFHL